MRRDLIYRIYSGQQPPTIPVPVVEPIVEKKELPKIYDDFDDLYEPPPRKVDDAAPGILGTLLAIGLIRSM
jgi:hypothetical protein